MDWQDPPAGYSHKVLVLFPLSSSSFDSAIEIKRVKIRFLVDGMVQAHSYNMRKVPLFCMKPVGYRGIIGCLYLLDYLSEFGKGDNQ